MASVLIGFYWGGSIEHDQSSGGVFYSIHAKWVCSVHHEMTLSELFEMLHPRVVSPGERVKLHLVCRYPTNVYHGSITNYMSLSINDDSMSERVLDIPVTFPSITCVEIYVEKEPLPISYNMS